MAARRVSVLGGGPAGLFAARLLARDHPDWQLTVYERLAPDDTFGFGIGLTPGLLATLRDADPVLHDDLVAASNSWSSFVFRLPHGRAELPHSHAGGISRAELLQLLLARAREAGVQVEIGASPTVDDLRHDADLVIAADGAASATREQLAGEVGAREQLGRGSLIWCGADVSLEGTVFMPVTTEHGTFVAHAYPYAEARSTFVIETDEASLTGAGCRMDAFADDGASDESSLRYLSNAFSELLGGEALIGNRSRWMHFRTVRCERWSHDNIVLLGDAAATADPSLGSGTKLALEAAAALAETLRDRNGQPPSGHLDEFEAARRPAVERLQDRALRSQRWWDSFSSRLGLSPARIAVAYMSRAGAISLRELRGSSPALADQAAADFAGVEPRDVPGDDLPAWVLRQPLSANGLSLPERLLNGAVPAHAAQVDVDCDDPWGGQAQAIVDYVTRRMREGAHLVELTGSASRAALLDRLALGERLRHELGALVSVSCLADQLDDAVDGLVAGRADLVAVT